MISMNQTKTEVIVCPDCKGMGEVYKDPGQHAYHYDRNKCKTCKGAGRLIKKTTVSFRPHESEPALIIRI